MTRLTAIVATTLLCCACVRAAEGKGSEYQDRKPGILAPAESAPEETVGLDDAEPEEGSVTFDSEEWIDFRLQKMNALQKAAQLMIVTLQGSPLPDSSDRALLRTYTPGGVIVPRALKPTTAAAYVANVRGLGIEIISGIPLLIGTNLYELPMHGRGAEQYFVALPSLLSLAAADDPEGTRKLAVMMADHLSLMGFNFHLGPPLVLAPTIEDAKGSVDCLGSDPRFAAETAGIILETLIERGIVVMPVGFPGGGLNRMAKTPAVLTTSLAELPEKDLAPFQRAVDAGVTIIHTGNTLVPTLDPARVPASLSPVVMREMLRNRMQFEGVVAAGPMDAPEIMQAYRPVDAALTAVGNGADMILWNQSGQHVIDAVERIATAVEDGELEAQRLDDAVRRILALKQASKLAEHTQPRMRETDDLEKKRQYPREAEALERKSITLIRNRNAVLPIRETSLPVGITGVAGVTELYDILTKEYKKAVKKGLGQQSLETAKHGGDVYDFEIDRATKNLKLSKTIVVVLSSAIRASGQRELVRQLKEQGSRVVVVAIGYPDLAPEVLEADAILLVYCDPSALAQSVPAIADVLMGYAALGFMDMASEVRTKVAQPESFSVFDLVRTPSGRLPVAVNDELHPGFAVAYDPTKAIKKALWDFGDGEKSKEFVVEKSFTAPGRYPVTLSVTDRDGKTISKSVDVVVE